ncbi:DUF6916 family protein [Tropicibacter sp. S64]|uniref:DUF6916 family protein n=1 Tax=Tropicibacter sp. S64 TaxID=3415122 RepID=UPI003C7D9887
MTDLAILKIDHFAPLAGQTVRVAAEGQSLDLTLDNVKALGAHTSRDTHLEVGGRVIPPREAFVLVLEGPREPVLPQQTYPLTFPELGTLDLFMVPFRQDHACTLYEIGFS